MKKQLKEEFREIIKQFDEALKEKSETIEEELEKANKLIGCAINMRNRINQLLNKEQ